MTLLRAPAPETVMLRPSHDGRYYAPAPADEHVLFQAARRVADQVIACVSATPRGDMLGNPAARREAEEDEAAALVAGWKALSLGQR